MPFKHLIFVPKTCFSFNLKVFKNHQHLNPAYHSEVCVIGGGLASSLVSNMIPVQTPVKSLYLRLFSKNTYSAFEGFELVTNGLKECEDLNFPVLKLFNEYFGIEFDTVLNFEPTEKKIYTLDREYTYTHLIIAEELVPNLNSIKGLKEAIENPYNKVGTICDIEFLEKTTNLLENYILKNEGEIIFYDSGNFSKNFLSMINCAFLFEAKLRKKNKNLRKNTKITYITKNKELVPGREMFSSYLKELLKKKEIEIISNSELIEVDCEKNKIFLNNQNKKEELAFSILIAEPEYDLPYNLKGSPFYNQEKKLLNFNSETLMSEQFENVYGIGGCCHDYKLKKSFLNMDSLLHESATVCKNIAINSYYKSEGKFSFINNEEYTYGKLYLGSNKMAVLEIDGSNEKILDLGMLGFFKEMLYYPKKFKKFIPQGKWYGMKHQYKVPDFELKKLDVII